MNIETIKKLKGVHKIQDIARILKIKETSARNVLTKLKKEHYAAKWMLPKYYRISPIKQLPRKKGMYDWVNKYGEKQVAEAYDHQVHGGYGPEEALVDAINTGQVRMVLHSLKLFNHITDWPKLYKYAKSKDSWRKIGALYEVARKFYRVRRFPKRYKTNLNKCEWQKITTLGERNNFPEIQEKWKVYIPINEHDIKEQY